MTEIKLYRVRFVRTIESEIYVHAENEESACSHIEQVSSSMIANWSHEGTTTIKHIEEVDE